MKEVAIEFKNVSKQFKGSKKYALNHIDLSIYEGEFITILGSSGSGKTTLMKMINRLYEVETGTLEVFGENIKDQNKEQLRRSIGYVIQQVGLFPHMTIAENIATLPRLLKWDKSDIDVRVRELLSLVDLKDEEFQSRYPSQLSGGQQQRVGLARALAANPNIMLLDEPFGAIDATTRVMLQKEILRIHGGLHKTFVFITHDINEAFTLGDRVVIMSEGTIQQFDTPKNIIQHPANDFVNTLIQSALEQVHFWEELL